MEWVSANELMKAFGGPLFPAYSAQAEAICKRANAGMLRACADRLFIADESRDSVPVPRGFWWAEGREALEQDWERGDFSTWIDGRYHRAFGVRFCKDDAEAMGALFNSSSIVADATADPGDIDHLATRNKGGRKMSAWWPEFVAQLVKRIHDEGVPSGTGTDGADALIEEVFTKLMERGVEAGGRTTVQDAVNATLRLLRADN